jgi:hypothetical protein
MTKINSARPLLTVNDDGTPVYGEDLGPVENIEKLRNIIEENLNGSGVLINDDKTVIFGEFHSIEVLENIAATEPGEVKNDFLKFFHWGDTMVRADHIEQRRKMLERDHARAVSLLKIVKKMNLTGAFSQKFKHVPALPGFISMKRFAEI